MAEQTPDPNPTTSEAENAGRDDASAASMPTPEAAAAATEAIDQATRATDALRAEMTGGSGDDAGPRPVDLPDLGGGSGATAESGLELLSDVDLAVTVELGRTKMYIEDVLHLNENSVVELDKAAGDPVDIFVNDRHVARGEVLVLDESFCVRVTEIIAPLTADD